MHGGALVTVPRAPYEQGEGIDQKTRAVVQFMVKREGIHSQV